MKTIFRVIPVFALCATLAACGDSETTTTTTSDTTTLNGSPLSNTASDNTGTGIEGGTVNTGPGTTTGGSTGSTTTSGSSSGSAAGDPGTAPGTTTDAGSTSDRTSGRNTPGTRITKEDSVNNRTGLAPVK